MYILKHVVLAGIAKSFRYLTENMNSLIYKKKSETEKDDSVSMLAKI